VDYRAFACLCIPDLLIDFAARVSQGASLSYHHPVARIISVVWWGIYLGCLGASIGALPGLFLGGIRTRCSREAERAARPLSRVAKLREDRARPKQRADCPVS
jgi:hypothetical protein